MTKLTLLGGGSEVGRSAVLIEGKKNSEIGQLMLISERTVKFYVRNLMKKFAATNRYQLVANAVGQRMNGLTSYNA